MCQGQGRWSVINKPCSKIVIGWPGSIQLLYSHTHTHSTFHTHHVFNHPPLLWMVAGSLFPGRGHTHLLVWYAHHHDMIVLIVVRIFKSVCGWAPRHAHILSHLLPPRNTEISKLRWYSGHVTDYYTCVCNLMCSPCFVKVGLGSKRLGDLNWTGFSLHMNVSYIGSTHAYVRSDRIHLCIYMYVICIVCLWDTGCLRSCDCYLYSFLQPTSSSPARLMECSMRCCSVRYTG